MYKCYLWKQCNVGIVGMYMLTQSFKNLYGSQNEESLSKFVFLTYLCTFEFFICNLSERKMIVNVFKVSVRLPVYWHIFSISGTLNRSIHHWNKCLVGGFEFILSFQLNPNNYKSPKQKLQNWVHFNFVLNQKLHGVQLEKVYVRNFISNSESTDSSNKC